MADHFYGMPARRNELHNTLMRPSPARVLTTFDAGFLIPLWDREMLPGETIEIDPSFIVRSQTPIHPVMDDAYLDIFCWYCPNRLVQDSWEKVMGGIKFDYWGDTTEKVVPKVTAGSNGFLQGSVADYFGLPIGVSGIEVNALPFRMYALIGNEYVRDQNLQPPYACPTNDTDVTSPTTLSDPVLDAYKGGSLIPMSRLPDYFSTCTPGPLKATNVVSIGLPDVPIVQIPSPTTVSTPGVFSPSWMYEVDPSTKPGRLEDIISNPRLRGVTASGSDRSSTGGEAVSSSTPPDSALYLGLQAATSSVGISINDFRFAVQLQKLLERDLFGTRYTEILKAHFGVTAQDSRLQRPELYGWRRYRLNQQQVAQTSATGSTGTPQGNLSAYSLTVGAGGKWRVLSPEHGHVIICGCIRVKHSYSQGIERKWSRFSRYDFAWPEFIGLGNQPVYTKEIAAGLTGSDGVFGYQEYAADYRYNRRIMTGEMRPDATGTLASWHYGDYYQLNAPQLNSTWIADHSKELIDRTLAVTSVNANQFFGCFDFATEVSTWLPMYSIPGYVDHF